MKQLTIISGKGGTGKTTLAAAFASLARDTVFADCDVDAPDLHLILKPTILEEKEFIGSKVAVKKDDVECEECVKCWKACRFDAIDAKLKINEIKCEGCGACVEVCPNEVIELQDRVSGWTYESDTRFGPMAHARLKMGEEVTGKLVTQVRNNAKKIAEEQDRDLIIVDGSPGIGCPVIASLTGADLALIVSEPTVSGLYDLTRILDVARHFGIPAAVCVNKYDINEEKTGEIEDYCKNMGAATVGKLPYDNIATEAMIIEQSIIEFDGDSGLSQAIKDVWNRVAEKIEVSA